MKNHQTLTTIGMTVNTTAVSLHIHHISMYSNSHDTFVLLIATLVLALTYDAIHTYLVLKKIHHTRYEEFIGDLNLIFTAATFSNLLSDNFIQFGIYSFLGLLAKQIISK